MEQEGLGAEARLIFITHEAAEVGHRRRPSTTCASSTVVDRIASMLRVVAA